MNYLLPQGLATVATEHHKRMVDKHKARLQEIQNQRLAHLRHVADQLGKQSITIEANANDEGHLYGSVGALEIVKALKQHDITITADQVRLKGPLKELGLYTVLVHLGQDIEGELKVWVVPTVADEVAEKKKEEKPKEEKPRTISPRIRNTRSSNRPHHRRDIIARPARSGLICARLARGRHSKHGGLF